MRVVPFPARGALCEEGVRNLVESQDVLYSVRGSVKKYARWYVIHTAHRMASAQSRKPQYGIDLGNGGPQPSCSETSKQLRCGSFLRNNSTKCRYSLNM